MCLITPLGKVSISIDGKEIDYTFKKINPDRLCNDVDAHYFIIVPFTPNVKNHQISCTIKNYHPSSLDEIESGERLVLKSFYKKNTKLSIGAIGEALDNYDIITIGYDYENNYLSNGVSYEILDFTKTNQFVFAICWINDYTDENELQTWFGADPTTFTLETVYGDYDNMKKFNDIPFKNGNLKDYNPFADYGIGLKSKKSYEIDYILYKSTVFVLHNTIPIANCSYKKYSNKYAYVVFPIELVPFYIQSELLDLLESMIKHEGYEYAFTVANSNDKNDNEIQLYVNRGYKVFNEIQKDKLSEALGANINFNVSYRKDV